MEHPRKVSEAESLAWFGWTDRGKFRPNNEDAFLGLQFDAREIFRLGKLGGASLEKTDFTFAVCDGNIQELTFLAGAGPRRIVALDAQRDRDA